ncbi:hypothetical protein I546_2151 [Mycobacterium kansasii 732]|nr:hypothetical protein I546_2151 [Mycobacterium kansasii 732]
MVANRSRILGFYSLMMVIRHRAALHSKYPSGKRLAKAWKLL